MDMVGERWRWSAEDGRAERGGEARSRLCAWLRAALGAVPPRRTPSRPSHGVTVAAFQHAGDPWDNADHRTVQHAGDRILVVGKTRDAEAFAQRL
jgi:hypothetical protein